MLNDKTIQSIYIKSLEYLNETKLINFKVDKYYIEFVYDNEIKMYKYFIINKSNYDIYIIDVDRVYLFNLNREIKINKLKNRIGKKQ